MRGQQTALARFGELALKSHDLDEILTEACRLVGEALGTDLAKVVELQEDGETLLVRAGIGWKPGVVGQVALKLRDGTSEGHAIKTGEPVISSNIDDEDRFEYAPFLKENGVKAMVNVLIIGADDHPPFGILQVDSRKPREFSESDITFLRGYANLLAAAVDRLRVVAAMRDNNQELERRVAERTRELTEANRKLWAEAEERERAERALRQAQQMEALVEHLPVGAGLVDRSGRIMAANPELRRLLARPVIPSFEAAPPGEWVAFHPDGRRVEARDYPGARALRGEVALNQDFLYRDGASSGGRWRRVSGIPMPSEDGGVAAALVLIADIDEEKRATDRQTLLTRELDHRAKNMLAVVQAALRLTRADDLAGFVQAIEGRVAALARAQTLLAKDRWAGADLHAILRGELAAFLDGGSGPRAELRGPPVALPPGAAQPLSMAVHELATNAVKYGALSAPAGRVSISWRVGGASGGVLGLRWVESGGPPPKGPPAKRGFGSRVLEGTLRGQLGGAVSMEWNGDGLACEIEVPLGRAERIVGDDAALAGFEAQEPAEADREEGVPRSSG
ncbi:HWE histidine kinase domain-containing protein [Craurococcus roseus]|uniref:histidine kinase n=1 Tax=Craurococcus roseus TaxID=77585 RepID=A0ABP3QZQ7_9PROT